VQIIVDFDGPSLQALNPDENVEADIECTSGTKLMHHTVVKNPVNGTWRLVMNLVRPTKAVDLRAALKRDRRPATETWIWTCQP
jgi:glucans biosynthesis protein